MNDITKAKHFLKARKSDLQHLETFALMYNTAEAKYRELKMRQTSGSDAPGTWDEREAEAMINYAVLRYLRRHNQLPKDVSSLFQPGTSPEEKQRLARKWANE